MGGTGQGQERWHPRHHVYSGPPVPVFLLTVFGKGEKSDISKAERNELRKVLKGLVARYMEGVKERAR